MFIQPRSNVDDVNNFMYSTPKHNSIPTKHNYSIYICVNMNMKYDNIFDFLSSVLHFLYRSVKG